MKDDAEHSLGIVDEMRRHSVRRTIRPRWVGLAMAALGGLLFFSVAEFGRLGLAVFPVILLVVAIHRFRAGVWPHFFRPSKDVLGEIRDELTSKFFVSILLVCGTVSSPFFLLKVLELRAGGNLWVSYAGGALVAIFLCISAESSRDFALKRSTE